MSNKFTQFFSRILGITVPKITAVPPEHEIVVERSAIDRENMQSLMRSVAAETFRDELSRAAMSGQTNPWSSILAMGQVTESPIGAVHFDNPIYYSTPQSPKRRPLSYVTVDQLRTFAETYDVLRSCIQHLKREVLTVPIEIVARNRKETGANKQAIKQAELFFAKPGGLGGISKERSWFEMALLEDLMIVGVATAFYHPTKSGGIYQVVELDASTIRPRTDAFGWPGPGDYHYEQWILGLPWAQYKDTDISFMGMPQNCRSYSPYPASPVEWLVNVILGAISADKWNLAWLTSGTTPNDLIALPDTWSPSQIQEFQSHFTAILNGNSNGRQQTRFLPGGSQKVGNPGRKDQDFAEYEMWLLKRTCSIMGVQPASIGYAGDQYKESQGESMRTTSAFGAGALLAWRKDFYDDVLDRIGLPQLEILNLTDADSTSLEKAQLNRLTVGSPHRTINDARREDGLDPVDGGDVILVQNNLTTLDEVVRGKDEPVVDPARNAPDPAGLPAEKAAADPSDPADPETELGKDKDATGDITTGDNLDRALGQWKEKSRKALRRSGLASCRFVSDVIPESMQQEISDGLSICVTADDINRLFISAKEAITW